MCMSQRTFLGRILANGRTSSELRCWRKKSEFLVFIIQLLGVQSPTNTSSSDVQNHQNGTFTNQVLPQPLLITTVLDSFSPSSSPSTCSSARRLRCWKTTRTLSRWRSGLMGSPKRKSPFFVGKNDGKMMMNQSFPEKWWDNDGKMMGKWWCKLWGILFSDHQSVNPLSSEELSLKTGLKT